MHDFITQASCKLTCRTIVELDSICSIWLSQDCVQDGGQINQYDTSIQKVNILTKMFDRESQVID